MRRKIAFQGELGAFSQIAAGRLAGADFIPVPIEKFEDVFVAVSKGKCHAAAILSENTLHGSVHENYDHLLKFGLEIRGETFVRIVHNLMAPPRIEVLRNPLCLFAPGSTQSVSAFLQRKKPADRAHAVLS